LHQPLHPRKVAANGVVRLATLHRWQFNSVLTTLVKCRMEISEGVKVASALNTSFNVDQNSMLLLSEDNSNIIKNACVSKVKCTRKLCRHSFFVNSNYHWWRM